MKPQLIACHVFEGLILRYSVELNGQEIARFPVKNGEVKCGE